jgi:rhomboid-like protein
MLGQQINSRSVVFNLVMINVVMFVITYFQDDFMTRHFALFYPGSTLFQPIQIVSHMFMHANVGHIFFNMFALWMFGNILEQVWGPKRFLTFYLITGFGAVALHLGVMAMIVHNATGSFHPPYDVVAANPVLDSIYRSPTVGASGAIFGVLIAFAMLFPNTELMLLFFPVPIKAKYLVPGYVILEIYLGISNHQGDNVAHFAHLGGALFGYLLVKYWNRDNRYLY